MEKNIQNKSMETKGKLTQKWELYSQIRKVAKAPWELKEAYYPGC